LAIIFTSVDNTIIWCFEESKLDELGKRRAEPLPYPGNDVLSGRIIEHLIQVVVVDGVESLFAHQLLDFDEIHGHAAFGVDFALNEDDELVVMTVGMKAGPFVMRKPMGGVELNLNAKQHELS
jgi:hypothetical protein